MYVNQNKFILSIIFYIITNLASANQIPFQVVGLFRNKVVIIEETAERKVISIGETTMSGFKLINSNSRRAIFLHPKGNTIELTLNNLISARSTSPAKPNPEDGSNLTTNEPPVEASKNIKDPMDPMYNQANQPSLPIPSPAPELNGSKNPTDPMTLPGAPLDVPKNPTEPISSQANLSQAEGLTISTTIEPSSNELTIVPNYAVVELDQNHQYSTVIRINNSEPLTGIIDTGANLVTLNSSIADQLQLDYRKRSNKINVNTANDTVIGFKFTLDKIQLGGIILKNIEGIVLEDREDPDVILIGMSFLKSLRLSYSENKLEIKANNKN